MNIHRLIQFSVLSLSLFITSISTYANDNTSASIIPCDIKLIFGVNSKGQSVASYVLEVQVTNRTSRPITSVSLYLLDEHQKIVSNSEANCSTGLGDIAPAQTGSCKQTLQEIGEQLLNRLGQETWTEIINSELKNFLKIRQCAVVGYRSTTSASKTY